MPWVRKMAIKRSSVAALPELLTLAIKAERWRGVRMSVSLSG
jgi:hypothetical protein